MVITVSGYGAVILETAVYRLCTFLIIDIVAYCAKS